MSKKILFSPVGGTDPIAQDNYKDGSLLHICRFYKPDKVILYMSHEMLEFHRNDNRYLFCLDKLAGLQHRECEYELIERDSLKNVQEFDYFYDDFKKCFDDVSSTLEEGDELLVNISSGTPAMKSGLLVLVTLGEFKCKTIQVVTPIKKLNEHSHIGYDVETLWELNEDNADDCENRCREVTCPSLTYIKQKEILKQLVREYDYMAALTAASSLPGSEDAGLVEVLEVAYKRTQVDFSGAGKAITKYEIDGFPIKSGDIRKYYEYVLALDLKRKRKEYADFIRGISPIIFDLFTMILRHEFNVSIEDYTVNTNKRGLRWDAQKLNNRVGDILRNSFRSFDDSGPVYSSQLIYVILDLGQGNTQLINTVTSLREIEEKIRNIAAHQIVSVSDDTIKKLTGYTALDVIKFIHRAFTYAGINIKGDYWDAYEQMNASIVAMIDAM